MQRWLATLLIATGLAVAASWGAASQAQTAQRCFAETGFCIAGRIRSFWE